MTLDSALTTLGGQHAFDPTLHDLHSLHAVSALLGLTQIILIVMFHKSLEQVVEMQIISMVILLFFQLAYFFYQNKKNVRLN